MILSEKLSKPAEVPYFRLFLFDNMTDFYIYLVKMSLKDELQI